MRKWEPVIVSWRDAVTYYPPASSKAEFALAERRTIGFFLRRTPESITVAMEDDRASRDDEDCQTITAIPSGMIISVTSLTERRSRTR